MTLILQELDEVEAFEFQGRTEKVIPKTSVDSPKPEISRVSPSGLVTINFNGVIKMPTKQVIDKYVKSSRQLQSIDDSYINWGTRIGNGTDSDVLSMIN